VPQITDPAGDGHHRNEDVVAAWFSEQAGRLQAVIQVTEGSWVPEHEGATAGWAFLYSIGGQTRYVRVQAPPPPAPIQFDHGTWTRDGGFLSAGPTVGVAETGASGAVTFDVPGTSSGTLLTRPFVLTYDGDGSVDRAPGGTTPDGTEFGADYVAGSCNWGGGGSPGTRTTAVALQAPRRLVGGGRPLIRGSVTPARGGVPVVLTSRTRRTMTRNLTSAPDGTFAIRMRIAETTRLRAEAEGIGSQTLTVVVKSTVRIRVRRTDRGAIRIIGRVRPALPGRVLLLRSDAVKPMAVRRPRDGRFTFRFNRLRRGRYQAVFIPSKRRALRSTSNTGVIR
jgi:hypothetical protein